MSGVSNLTLLYSPGTGAARAWEFGPARLMDSITLDTLWLPNLIVGAGTEVETFRGWVPAEQIRVDDYLRVTRDNPDVFVPFEEPHYLHFPGREAHEWYLTLRQGQPVKIVDMMECPAHVAHWREDLLMLQPRALNPWYSGMVSEGPSSWWMRVLQAQRGLTGLVPLTGCWEAYGIPIRTCS